MSNPTDPVSNVYKFPDTSRQAILDNWGLAELETSNERAAIRAAIHGILFRHKINELPGFDAIKDQINYCVDGPIDSLMKRVYDLAQQEAKEAVKFYIAHGPMPGDDK